MAHMASIPKAAELAALSISDRLDLMDQIWSSLAPDGESIPLPAWHRREIERELASLEADGNPGRPVDEVFRELKSRL